MILNYILLVKNSLWSSVSVKFFYYISQFIIRFDNLSYNCYLNQQNANSSYFQKAFYKTYR